MSNQKYENLVNIAEELVTAILDLVNGEDDDREPADPTDTADATPAGSPCAPVPTAANGYGCRLYTYDPADFARTDHCRKCAHRSTCQFYYGCVQPHLPLLRY